MHLSKFRAMITQSEFMISPLNGSIHLLKAPFAPSSTLSSILEPVPIPSKLNLESRLQLCREVSYFGGELVKDEELKVLLQTKSSPICYDGFEPSGRMHIAQGVMKAINVNKLTSAGCVFVFWIADWFALLNNKMGGDLYKIQRVGQYFIEVWKAVGMNMDNVRFLWASTEINKNPSDYWLRVMNIARSNTISRIKRCSQIMGRAEGDDQQAASMLYPCMQCADVYYLHADICQLGLDQRKVNALAREYLDSPECQDRPRSKPVILSHGMLPGLLEGQEKMSKSDPDSAIFMEDSVEDVNRKLKKAFCPPNIVEGNPCVQYVRMLVFPMYGSFDVSRREQDGGDIVFKTEAAFIEAYTSGAVHPSDLKTSLCRAINRMLDPVRKHFAEDPVARKLVEEVRSFKVTK